MVYGYRKVGNKMIGGKYNREYEIVKTEKGGTKFMPKSKQKVEVQVELEGVFHLKALLQDPEVREEIQSIIKEWVEDGGITANIDTT
jgi:hypothetical protein